MVGSAVRSTLSTQPVHSCSCSQTTDGRFTAASAAATLGVSALLNPRIAVISPQKATKSRRLTPRLVRYEPSVSPSAQGCEVGINMANAPDAERNWAVGVLAPAGDRNSRIYALRVPRRACEATRKKNEETFTPPSLRTHRSRARIPM